VKSNRTAKNNLNRGGRYTLTGMKRPFILGIAGGLLGILIAAYVIVTAPAPATTLSGVQAALFFALGLMGAALVASQPRFAGWMLLSSAVWIFITAPVTGGANILWMYLPAIALLIVASLLSFKEPEGPAGEITGEPIPDAPAH
jgi:hypothetical protein